MPIRIFGINIMVLVVLLVGYFLGSRYPSAVPLIGTR